MIDLHIHSTASDGSLKPLEIIDLAKTRKLQAVSLTDHDTIDGAKEILKQSHVSDPEFITGVEISCSPPPEFKNLGSIHLLGYGFSVHDKNLNEMLEKAKHSRNNRNPEIVKKIFTMSP